MPLHRFTGAPVAVQHASPAAGDHHHHQHQSPPESRRARIKNFYAAKSNGNNTKLVRPVSTIYPESIRPRSVSLNEAMGLLKHFRSRSKSKSNGSDLNNSGSEYYVSPPQASLLHPESRDYINAVPTRSRPQYTTSYSNAPYATPGRADFTARLPQEVLQRICGFVCPHTLDHSYVTSEHSTIGDGCMLCDLRDLAKTAQVSRRWYRAAQSMLYSSVRIDAVHYCELEAILAEKRHRKSFRHPVDTATDVPGRRLALFCRSVRESPTLAQQVEILKLPYMTRESSKGELAATVAVLPNLKYVDLPDGAFSGDPACHTLLHELQARCPELRKMSFYHGAESQLESIAVGHWQALQQVEINGVVMEPSILRLVLASLPTLHHLMLSDLVWLNDQIFFPTDNIPPFPPLQSLALQRCPLITSAGLKQYLTVPLNRQCLDTLHLRQTGVTVPAISDFLYDADHLTELTYVSKVTFTDSLTLGTAPSFASLSLQNLIYEISDSDEAGTNLTKPSSSFYAYLVRSLHSNLMPSLHSVYVRDAHFVDTLLLPPVPSPSGTSSTLNSSIEIFSKARDEDEYTYTFVTPAGSNSPLPSPGLYPAHTSSGANGRPLSAYGFPAVAPTTTGPSFLSVPDGASASPVPRPRSSGSDTGGVFGSAANTPRVGAQAGRMSTFSPLLAQGSGNAWPSAQPGGVGTPGAESEKWGAGSAEGAPGRLSGLVAKVGLGHAGGRRGKKRMDLWR